MSLTSLISSSDSSFKLSQKLVTSLAEKFGFKFEDGWSTVSNRTVENVQKRLKRERRRNNPLSSVKKPRTAFSFYTQEHRPVVQKANPNANFGELSRLVSADWKKLSDSEMAKYKAMESADKSRYQGERETVQANVASQATDAAAVVPATAVAAPAKEKKVRAPRESAVPVATPAAAAATVAEAKPAKGGKKTATPVVAAAVVAAAPVAEAKPAKGGKKAVTPTATPAPASTAAPAPASTAAPAPASTAAPATTPVAAATPAPKAAKKAGKQ
jgi:hypothetical protein